MKNFIIIAGIVLSVATAVIIFFTRKHPDEANPVRNKARF